MEEKAAGPVQELEWNTILRLEERRKTLPNKPSSGLATTLRVTVFTVYRQLLLITCIANLVGVVVVTIQSRRTSAPPLNVLASAAIGNLTVAVIMRQDYMVNFLFATCWNVSHNAPLRVRRQLARVYENGGVHSGCAIGATLWTFAFVGFLARTALQGSWRSAFVLGTSLFLLVLLLLVIVGAIPSLRRRHHNLFENTHRLGGWACVLLYWPTLLLFLQDQAKLPTTNAKSFGLVVIQAPAFWMLLIISINVVYPWLLLRKVPVVKVEHFSDHAIRIYFSPRERMPPLHGCTISDAPLREWHSFAAIPDLDGSEGGANSCIVSKAGDWTTDVIRNPRAFYYMRGMHRTGVLGMAKVFRSVILMSTGSGIGPCLSILGQVPNTRVRVIWSAPDPVSTFGDKVCERVLKYDPNAIIFNTRKIGQQRPDLVQAAFDLHLSERAEAVFFISNRGLTKKVVEGLEAKGVSVFAPVFDS